MIYGILGELTPLIGYLTSLIFMIFIVIAMSRAQSKLGVIFGIIILLLEFLYMATYVIFYTLYIELGVISPSITFLYIVLYSMMGIAVLLGISYIIAFVLLAKNLETYSNLRDMKLIHNFTKVFGIFQGLYYILMGISTITFVMSGTPPDWVLQVIIISTYAAIVFSGIAGLSLIIISVGYILSNKRN